MTQQTMGTLDFFLLEGNEYLDRLDALAQTPSGVFAQGDELLRLCRAFRGSAIMASQHGMARAGQGLESCARAIRENRLGWTEGTRAELVRAIDDIKILMRRLRQPEQGDTEKAEQIGISLDRTSGRASAQMRAAAGPGLDAGGRAFVAREAASIASVLSHTSRTLRSDPANREALTGISPAMSALRGVAVINDLPPLGEILSAIEHAAKDVLAAAGTLGPDVADVFDAGAKALARAAREVVDAGRPDAEAEESHAFAARLFSVLTGGGVVSIESLFYDDAGPHIVHQGASPNPVGAGLARVEIVSHGEYLSAAAAELGRVTTPVQRDLRLYAIAASMRPMVGAGGSPLSSALGKLADAARDAIGRGAASHRIQDFVQHMQNASATLVAAQSGDENAIAERVNGAASKLAMLTASLATRSIPALTALPVEEVEARPETAAVQVMTTTPLSRMTPPSTPVPAAAAAPAPAAALGEADLATSYLTLEQLIADRGMEPGDITSFLSAPTAAIAPATTPPPVVRVTDPRQSRRMAEHTPPGMPAPSAPHAAGVVAAPEPPIVPVESLAPDADAVVPVQDLQYSGAAALRRAMELKPQLLAAAGDPARFNALLSEVFDLVELGIGAPR